jgi:thiol-disulfide isomerase/thioredoxin
MENLLGADNEKVLNLKKYYFILEGKHFLLAKKQQKCFGMKPSLENSIILYFYSNKGDCTTCDQESAVLTFLLDEYPGLKVYSFDSNLDSPVVDVFKKIYGVGNESPVLVINEKTYYGFMDKKAVIDAIND